VGGRVSGGVERGGKGGEGGSEGESSEERGR
jgi:hypothetical protein